MPWTELDFSLVSPDVVPVAIRRRAIAPDAAAADAALHAAAAAAAPLPAAAADAAFPAAAAPALPAAAAAAAPLQAGGPVGPWPPAGQRCCVKQFAPVGHDDVLREVRSG